MNDSTFIIAEAGVNHNGKSSTAFDLVDIAKQCGADAVKFQLFSASNLVTQYAIKAEYQSNEIENNKQFSMLNNLELPKKTYEDLKDYCKVRNINFLCTAFDSKNLNFLVNKLKLRTLKIASGEITNAPLLLAHARTKCNLIISTGMSNIQEVENALEVISFGYLYANKKPTKIDFKNAYNSPEGKNILKEKVTLLHCTTEYPAPNKDLNLKSIQSMKEFFDIKVGYSDHSEGINASLVAVYLGARIVEKHFTIDKKLDGPDHKASLEPNELKNLTKNIRSLDSMSSGKKKEFINSIKNLEVMMGNGVKEPMESEIKNINIARRYLVANENILIGDKFSKKNLTCKRSKKGISPMLYWDYLGKLSKKNYAKEDIIV